MTAPEPDDDLLAGSLIALTRMPPTEWRAHLDRTRHRAVEAGRMDVHDWAEKFLDRLGPEPSHATPDGAVRSRCVPIACGEAWIADRGTALPAGIGAPLNGYRYAGAVGTRSDDVRGGFPAVRLRTSKPPREITLRGAAGPFFASVTDLADIEWHDPHLLDGLDRKFTLVVDDHLRGTRFGAAHVGRVEPFEPHTPRDECMRLRSTLALYPDDRGYRCHEWYDLTRLGAS